MEMARVIVWGVGGVGSGAVRLMLEKEGIEIVGALDVAEEKAGKDLGEVVGANRKLGIVVSDDPDTVFSEGKANMVLHLTLANWDETESQIIKAVAAGCNVISTADMRIIYPWADYPELGKRVDKAAKRNGITVLGTGRGPGFMCDLVPIVFTGACAHITKIAIKFMGGVWGPSKAMAAILGIGLTVEEFNKRVTDATARMVPAHVSVQMIADALGWKLDETRLTIEPITSNKWRQWIEPGRVCGYRLLASGIRNGQEMITLDSTGGMPPEAEGLEPISQISIEGEPDIEVVVKGYGRGSGVENWTTVVNHIPLVMQARPGLVTVRELPVAATLP